MIRENGREQPYIPLGIFKLRLPFVHYKWEMPEALQAIFMSAVCLGAIPMLTENLGVSFEIAWSMVIINGLLYNLHSLLGDPVVPGWITPSIPLTIIYLNKFGEGTDRIHALMSLQFIVAVIFLFMGTTGLSEKLMKKIPVPLKSGILLGAGFAAIVGEFNATGRFSQYPISIFIGGIVCCYLLFSKRFKEQKIKNKFAEAIGKYGMLPAIVVSIVIGPIAGELPMPIFKLGSFIKIPEISELIKTVSPFGIGFPELSFLIEAFPMAVLIYIIAVGDLVTSEALVSEADKIRTDEKIDFNSNRSNIISGIRNYLQALLTPYIPMSGPLAAAVTASVAERYKNGQATMDSIFGGIGTYRIVTLLAVMLVPIVSFVQPVLPVALSLTMLVQGYICTRLAMGMCQDEVEMGIAGIMGGILMTKGALWGLLAGFLLYFLLLNKNHSFSQVSNDTK